MLAVHIQLKHLFLARWNESSVRGSEILGGQLVSAYDVIAHMLSHIERPTGGCRDVPFSTASSAPT